MYKPKVSVLLPCYNAAGTLPEALLSLQHQQYEDFEVVAVNDGSSDSTAEILEDWSRKDSRFITLHQPHTGIVGALQAGLKACQAPFVARMDSDDRSLPQRLALQVACLEADPQLDVVSCLVRGFPADQVRLGFRIYLKWLNSLVSDVEIRREIFVESPMAHPSVLFRREAVQRVGGYQENGWPEDYDLWLRLYLRGARFAKVPQILLEWRERPERLTRTDGRYSVENFLRAKANYLAQGPLADCQSILVWGAGMMGRRLSKHLIRHDLPLEAFVDVDPKKIGRTRRGRPIFPPDAIPQWWQSASKPVILAAVGARGARQLIRARLNEFGLEEGRDWWSVA